MDRETEKAEETEKLVMGMIGYKIANIFSVTTALDWQHPTTAEAEQKLFDMLEEAWYQLGLKNVPQQLRPSANPEKVEKIARVGAKFIRDSFEWDWTLIQPILREWFAWRQPAWDAREDEREDDDDDFYPPESEVLSLLHECINALIAIDRAKGALDEGAGNLLHDNPDRLAQIMNRACAHGQATYIRAKMALEALERGE